MRFLPTAGTTLAVLVCLASGSVGWGHIIGDWTSGDRSGMAIYLLARQDDGSWKISHDFVNSNGAPEENR